MLECYRVEKNMSVLRGRHFFAFLSVAVAFTITGCWELDLDLCSPASEQPPATEDLHKYLTANADAVFLNKKSFFELTRPEK